MKLDPKHPLYVIGFTAVFSAVLTSGIAALQVATAGRVARNETLRRDRALVRLFADAWGIEDASRLSDREVARLVEARIDAGRTVADPAAHPPVSFRLYEAYQTDRRDRVIGMAVPIGGNGFWAPIRGLVALDPQAKEVLGLEFVEQAETPGLGGRIMERAFQDQFRKGVREAAGRPPLRATPPEPGGKYLYIGRGTPTGPSDPRFGRSVDAITGATQTSLAVERFLNQDLQEFHEAWQAGAKRPLEGR